MTPINLNDLAMLAKSKMEPGAFDYYAGGAGDEETLRGNVSAFSRYLLRPRVLVDVSALSTRTTLLGADVSAPFGVAPSAFHRLAHPEAEVATARAAAKAGVVFCASTMSSCSLEEISTAGGTRWFQLYTHKERGITEDLVKRAASAGYKALVLTVDLPVFGRRERDLRQGFALPRGSLGNFKQYADNPTRLQEVLQEMHDASLTWRDVEWLMRISPLPVLLKGILTREDARLAVERGVKAIFVSNHGGRQLDRSPATIDVLEEIVDEVSGRCEVYLDGGVRRGVDVVTALALGARAVFVGRPALYGLAHNGEEGVSWVLATLQQETENAMAILGTPSLDALNKAHLKRTIESP